VWGGNGPDTFDCSGLMKWAWSHVGVNIPRVAADEQLWASPVPISQLAPGDFVFFGSPAHHVGMYIGIGMTVDAPQQRGLRFGRADLVGPAGRLRAGPPAIEPVPSPPARAVQPVWLAAIGSAE
jgi:cell wall-associated NlpC family hydrolase